MSRIYGMHARSNPVTLDVPVRPSQMPSYWSNDESGWFQLIFKMNFYLTQSSLSANPTNAKSMMVELKKAMMGQSYSKTKKLVNLDVDDLLAIVLMLTGSTPQPRALILKSPMYFFLISLLTACFIEDANISPSRDVKKNIAKFLSTDIVYKISKPNSIFRVARIKSMLGASISSLSAMGYKGVIETALLSFGPFSLTDQKSLSLMHEYINGTSTPNLLAIEPLPPPGRSSTSSGGQTQQTPPQQTPPQQTPPQQTPPQQTPPQQTPPQQTPPQQTPPQQTPPQQTPPQQTPPQQTPPQQTPPQQTPPQQDEQDTLNPDSENQYIIQQGSQPSTQKEGNGLKIALVVGTVALGALFLYRMNRR